MGDLEECIKFFHSAVVYEVGPVTERLKTSKTWAHFADSIHHMSSLKAYKCAINLLPHLASLDMNLQQRQEALSQSKGLACEAANCAIRNGELELAIEFLSTGRSVFWAQALHLCTPLDELADRLREISNILESGSIRHNSDMISLSSGQKIDLEKQLAHYQKLNEERTNILKEVRETKGFEDFLILKSFSKLQKAASNGPVVLLNASQQGCDTLILTTDGVTHVPLQNMKLQQVIEFAKFVQNVPGVCSNRDFSCH